jgi:hypothetical protein
MNQFSAILIKGYILYIYKGLKILIERGYTKLLEVEKKWTINGNGNTSIRQSEIKILIA